MFRSDILIPGIVISLPTGTTIVTAATSKHFDAKGKLPSKYTAALQQ